MPSYIETGRIISFKGKSIFQKKSVRILSYEDLSQKAKDIIEEISKASDASEDEILIHAQENGFADRLINSPDENLLDQLIDSFMSERIGF